jgi:hypothetical protein
MNSGAFGKNFPTLCGLLSGSHFMEEVTAAEKLPETAFMEAIELRKFKNAPLMDILSGAIVSDWTDIQGTDLERNLTTLADHLGFEETRKVFRKRLLVPVESSLQDVCYEIAVTARACVVLDPDSVQLEVPIQDASKAPQHLKNSDIRGTFQGEPVRIEVTVLHEEPPLSVDAELTERLERADVASVFEITMRAPLQTDDKTNAAIALLKSLHQHHIETGGANVNIGEIYFAWRDSVYESTQGPFERVVFHAAGDKYGRGEIRSVSHTCTLRRVTPEYLSADYPNELEVVDVLDFVKAAEPVSKKIRDTLQRKLAQCESGVVNLIAFGNPQRKDERSLRDALFGALIPVVQLQQDEHGGWHLSGTRSFRAPRAPFNPDKELRSDDDQETFINPFKILSGVWHIRLGLRPLSKVIPNPNALFTVPMELCNALSGAA